MGTDIEIGIGVGVGMNQWYQNWRSTDMAPPMNALALLHGHNHPIYLPMQRQISSLPPSRMIL